MRVRSVLVLWWAVALPLAYTVAPSPRRGLLEGLVLAVGSLALASWPPLVALVRGATPMSRMAVGGLLGLSLLAQTQQANARFFPASAFDMYGVARGPSLQWSQLRLIPCDGASSIHRMEEFFPALGYDLGVSLTGDLLASAHGATAEVRAAAGEKAHALLEAAAVVAGAQPGQEPLCAIAAELGVAPVGTPWTSLAAKPTEALRVDLRH